MADKELNTCGCGGNCGEDTSKEEGNCGCGGHENHDDCGCGHDHEEETLFVDFEDEDGNIVSFEVVDSFEYTGTEEAYKGGVYALVQDPSDASVFLMKADTDDSLVPVESEEEFEAVSKFYQEDLA